MTPLKHHSVTTLSALVGLASYSQNGRVQFNHATLFPEHQPTSSSSSSSCVLRPM